MYQPCTLKTNLFRLGTHIQDEDLDFGYNQHYIFTGNISIPDGYEFETPPRNIALIMPDTSILFRRYIEFKGNTAGYRITLEFKRPHYDVQEYPEFKKFYKLLFDKLSEQFVFKKKA